MARVRVVHWNAGEAAALLSVLRGAGYTVDYGEKLDPGAFRGIRQSPPDAVVIDLSRLPSHGREVAIFLRGHKATRLVPLVFVDGEPAFFLAGATSYSQELLLRRKVDGVSPDPIESLQTLDNILALSDSHPLIYLPSHDIEANSRLINLSALKQS